MIKVEHSIVVPRSVDEVFSFLSNFEHDPHWQTGILEAKQTPEGVTLVGTTINKKIWVKSISGPYPFEGGYALEPVDGGTKVTFLLSVQPRGIIRFTQSMVARELKKQMEMDSSRLRDLLKA
ncbi:MAG: hypothetical protein HYU46_21775 [Deltaproteobacteria bacterium]|nr:hypothetical protein [Deltaproteobacteria bacterium]